jgi:hypothetical protein
VAEGWWAIDAGIDGITMQTAPFMEVRPRVKGTRSRPACWKEIAGTRAWDDDDGHAEYMLHCTRLDGAARLTRSR